VAIGTRLGDFVTASKTAFQDPDVTFLGINVTPFDAAKLGGMALVADAKRALERLGAALEAAGWGGAPNAWRERARILKAEWDGVVDDLRAGKGLVSTRGGVDPGAQVVPDDRLAQGEVLGLVNDAVGGHATVICAAGSMPGDLLKLWRPEDPKAYHLEYGYSCMGYEIPAGIGVKLAEPERDVVVMIGDGSYLMMNSEIVTALTEGLRFTVVLVDNHGFQSIHGLQRASGTPSFLNELRSRGGAALDGPYQSIDFTAHAAALGANALYAPTREALTGALAAAREADRLTVIVVPTHPEKRVPGYEGWWDVPIAEATEQENVRAAKVEYDLGRTKQRLA